MKAMVRHRSWWSRIQQTPYLLCGGIVLALILLQTTSGRVFLGHSLTWTRLWPPSGPQGQVLVVSSTFVCDSMQGKDCAMRSWVRRHSFKNWIDDGSRVLILVDHEDDCERLPDGVMCKKHDCWHDALGLPKVGCLIQDSMLDHPNELIVFTNDDIAFTGLHDTITHLTRVFDTFVAVGRRKNVPLEFLDPYIQKASVSLNGEYEYNNAYDVLDTHELMSQDFEESTEFELDYFVFRMDPSVLDDYPDFLLGNWRWDNIMVDYLVMKNITVVDVSKSVNAYHLGKTSTGQSSRLGANYNDGLMRAYLMNTRNLSTGKERQAHPVVRFGSLNHVQYESERRVDVDGHLTMTIIARENHTPNMMALL